MLALSLAGRLRDQGGTISIITVVLFVIMITSGLFLFDIMAVYRAKGEAQTAADAASKAAGLELTPLFGVGVNPQGAAARYASLNGAELIGCELGGAGNMRWVTVKVRKKARTMFLPPGRKGFYVTATSRTYLDYGSILK